MEELRDHLRFSISRPIDGNVVVTVFCSNGHVLAHEVFEISNRSFTVEVNTLFDYISKGAMINETMRNPYDWLKRNCAFVDETITGIVFIKREKETSIDSDKEVDAIKSIRSEIRQFGDKITNWRKLYAKLT